VDSDQDGIASRSVGTLAVVATYAIFAGLWILFSDQLLGLFVADHEQFVRASMVKGWAFVAVTALLLYGLVGRLVGHIDAAHGRQLEADRQKNQAMLLLAAISGSSTDAIFAKDTDGCYLIINAAACGFVGKSPGEIIGKDDRAIFPPEQAEMLIAINRQIVADGRQTTAEEELDTPEGRRTFLATKGPLRDEAGRIFGTFGISRDITRRKQAEHELRIAATAFESQLGMIITDSNEIILRVNQAFTDISGFAAADVLGKTPRVLKSGRHDATFYEGMWRVLDRDRFWQGEIWNRHKGGASTPVLMNISAVVDEAGNVTHYVGAFSDISQHKQAEETIHSLSYYDNLTRLPNRRRMMERLKHVLAVDSAHACHGAVLFIDLDDFSSLNDTRGHKIGDLALQEAASRIRACVPGDDNVARPGSDEFVVMLEGLSPEVDHAAIQAQEVAERVQTALRPPLDLVGEDYRCTASIGISLFRSSETTVDELMRQADAAMYQVKRLGRDRIHFFDAGMQGALEERIALETSLRKAVPGQLLLHYQPQIDDEGKVFGAEVLVRWQHPEKGLIPPAAFIPLAEESGLILPIGRWVLETACRSLHTWETSPATRHLLLSVNVSAVQFHQPDFVDQVLAVIDATGADPTRLKLELTESMLLENADKVIPGMAALKARGIRFSLDDFGTGFSSLSYLKRLPLNQLKIDQSFVRDVESDPNDAAIVRTIIALGQSLGLNVIAEGVETDGQRNFLAVHGCKQFQGYLFGRPVPVEEFEQMLGGWRSNSTSRPSAT
jgi:diguanylate cyclase (GGDEF)-like protein/PAS domain S-box-containing protein